MQIIIELQKEIALEMRNPGSQTNISSEKMPETEQLLNLLAGFGVMLIPVHPGQMHPLLVSQFMIETKDRKTAEEIISRLQKFSIVEASYFRPDNELP
jgi:hypothetical protein